LRAIEWIVSRDLTADKKLHHINRLLSLGKVENLNLAEFIRLNEMTTGRKRHAHKDWGQLGEAMRALPNEKWRAFVYHLVTQTGMDH